MDVDGSVMCTDWMDLYIVGDSILYSTWSWDLEGQTIFNLLFNGILLIWCGLRSRGEESVY